MPQLEFRTGTLLLDGPVGAMELRIDAPAEPARGIAIVAHPHPLLGGSAMHKVPHLLAGALRDASWLAVRPNFRGVGASQGSHDEGNGEMQDMLFRMTELAALDQIARLPSFVAQVTTRRALTVPSTPLT